MGNCVAVDAQQAVASPLKPIDTTATAQTSPHTSLPSSPGSSPRAKRTTRLERVTEDSQRTLLHHAVIKADLATVKLLHRTRTADFNARDKLSNTALHFAASGGKLQVVSALLDAGSRVNVANNAGVSPLHLAVLSGSAPVVRLLLERGAWENFRDNTFSTPLHYAQSPEVIELLVSAGAKLEVANKKGETPMQHALAQHWRGAIKALALAGADYSIKGLNVPSPPRWHQRMHVIPPVA
ncbi:unnamed protein product [Chrysoparadoxa australica]